MCPMDLLGIYRYIMIYYDIFPFYSIVSAFSSLKCHDSLQFVVPGHRPWLGQLRFFLVVSISSWPGDMGRCYNGKPPNEIGPLI